MSLIPWREKTDWLEPFEGSAGPIVRLRDAMDDLFGRFLSDARGTGFMEAFPASWRGGLNADVAETDEEVTVKVELPGIDPKDVQVDITGQTLTIRGEKRQDREEKQRSYQYVERRFGSFHRSVPLPASVNAEKVDATFKNGVLTVSIPKRADARPKRIPVRTA